MASTATKDWEDKSNFKDWGLRADFMHARLEKFSETNKLKSVEEIGC